MLSDAERVRFLSQKSHGVSKAIKSLINARYFYLNPGGFEVGLSANLHGSKSHGNH
jgi:hypothetical protein